MKNGEIKFYNRTKEYGFVTDTEENKDYFFHKTTIEGNIPKDGDKVSFEGEEGERGLKATKVVTSQ